MAAQALHDGLIAFLKHPLMKSEKQEFQRLIEDSTMYLAAAPKLKEIFPIALTYTEGEERQLIETLKGLLRELQQTVADEAQSMLHALEELKRKELEQGQLYLDAMQKEEAIGVFNALLARFSEDSELKGDVAERYLHAGMYEEAFTVLAEAIEPFSRKHPLLQQYRHGTQENGQILNSRTVLCKGCKCCRSRPAPVF